MRRLDHMDSPIWKGSGKRRRAKNAVYRMTENKITITVPTNACVPRLSDASAILVWETKSYSFPTWAAVV